MTRRNKIIWGVVIGVIALLLLAMLLWALSLRKAVEPPLVVNQAPVNQAPLPSGGLGNVANINEPAPTPTPVAPRPADSASALKRLAASFAERYGSYSSLGDSSNQTDLIPLMTAAFGEATRAEVAARAGTPGATEYRGITTRAISVNVDDIDEAAGVATLTVKTQRAESVGDATTPSVRYQDVTLTFAKVEGAWKVGKVVWK